MMEQNKGDMVMRFKLRGRDVSAESMLRIADGDTLMPDFQRDTDYADYSNFFEIKEFGFGGGLTDDDGGGAPGRAKAPASRSKLKGSFVRWRSALEGDTVTFPFSFDTFEFSRLIDGASPIFFECCTTSQSFDEAVLVRRMSLGSPGNVERLPTGYLRIEFTKVLVINLNWDDGDVVTEKCTFTCQGMKVRYRPQSPSGGLLAEIQDAEWRPSQGDGSGRGR